MEGWGKVREAAAYAGVSPRTLRKWVNQGLAISRMPSGTILIHRDQIDRYISRYKATERKAQKIASEFLKGLTSK